MFKQNIGIMIAVAQLAATQPRFAAVQNEFRRFGMDIVAASVRRAQEQGYGDELDPEHIGGGDRAAVRELHHRLRRHVRARARDQRRGRRRHAVEDLEEDAVRVLRPEGESPWISPSRSIFRDCSPRWTRSSRPRSNRWNARTCSISTSVAKSPAPTGTTAASRAGVGGPARRDAQACRQGRLAALRPAVTVRWPRRHQHRHGGHPGAPGAQGTRAAQRPAGRVVDRRQLPAGDHDGPLRHRRAEGRVDRGPDHRRAVDGVRPDRAQSRVGRHLARDPRRAGRRRLGHQRRQAVQHRRAPGHPRPGVRPHVG